jgi:hypothetical protein
MCVRVWVRESVCVETPDVLLIRQAYCCGVGCFAGRLGGGAVCCCTWRCQAACVQLPWCAVCVNAVISPSAASKTVSVQACQHVRSYCCAGMVCVQAGTRKAHAWRACRQGIARRLGGTGCKVISQARVCHESRRRVCTAQGRACVWTGSTGCRVCQVCPCGSCLCALPAER